jgi:hypothetical protein
VEDPLRVEGEAGQEREAALGESLRLEAGGNEGRRRGEGSGEEQDGDDG